MPQVVGEGKRRRAESERASGLLIAYPLLAALLIFLALLPILWVLHAPSFKGPFYLDSLRHLEFRTNLHMVELSWRALRDAIRLDYGLQIYRPLSQLSFALNYWASGATPASFRAVNIVLHWVSAGALLFLALAILRSPRVVKHQPRIAEAAFPVAVLSMALWSLHPVQTNVVAYVVQRMTSLSGLFLFLGVGCYLRARREGLSCPWLAISLACLFLSLASKEIGLVALPLIVATEVFLLYPPPSRALRMVRNLAGLVVAAGVLELLLWQGATYSGGLNELYSTRPFSPWERLLTEARLQANYLLVLLIPDPRLLTLDAEVVVSRSLVAPPATAFMVAAVFGAVGLSVFSRKKIPLLGFGISWFLLAQVVEGTILPLELYFEHRMYVPSAMLFLGIVAVGATAFRHRKLETVLICGIAIFLGAEAWATHSRNAIWSQPIAFHLDLVAKAPGKPRPHTNLGYAFRRAGYLEEARSEFLAALDLGGEAAENLVNLAAVSYLKGNFDEARDYLGRGIRADPERAWTWQADWAQLELEAGNLQEAFRHVREALKQNPRDSRSLFLLGEILLAKGDPKQAGSVFETGLRYDPSRAPALWHLGQIRLGEGRAGEAVALFERAVRLVPEEPSYRKGLLEAQAALRSSSQ